MKSIKNFVEGLTTNYKKYIKQYTATNIVIIIATLIFTFANYEEWQEILNSVIIIAIISAINFFTIETYFKKINYRLIFYVLGLGVTIGIERLININTTDTLIRGVIGYSIIIVLVGIFKVIKNSKLQINEYCARVFKNLFSTGVIYTILNIGLTIILLIFIALFLSNGYDYDLIMRMQIALLGLFLIPGCLISVIDTETEVTKFIETIISFVLLPLTILATIIIYMYMAKIFILRQIPSNLIFRITSGLFVVAFPVWIMAYTFKEKSKIVENSCKIMPIAFIPFIGLQIYSIWVRLSANGVTPVRYLGVIFIIFEIVAIFLSLYKSKKYLIHTITAAIILTAISTILPFINMQTISNINQSARLKSAWREGESYENLAKEDKEKAESAYRYLRLQENFEKYIPDHLSKEILEDKLVENGSLWLDKYNSSTNKLQWISYKLDSDGVVSVEGYNRIKEVSQYFYDIEADDVGLVPLDSTYNIDIRDFVLNLIEENKQSKQAAENYIVNNKILKINENRDLCITQLELSYYLDDDGSLDEINYISFSGYMLIR